MAPARASRGRPRRGERALRLHRQIHGHRVVIDEQTKHAVKLTPPAGCFFDTDFVPLGGSWVVARCNSSSDELRLYSIPNRSWTRFTPDVARMCALNPDCATGSSRVPCTANYRAIGNLWIEFAFGCGYHSGTVTTALQQIRSGRVIVAPATEIPEGQGGGNEIVDLNSPTCTRRLCSPLRVPRHLRKDRSRSTLCRRGEQFE